MRVIKISVLCFAFFLIHNLINAQDRIFRGHNIQVENDLFSGLTGLKNKDKDYSGGFKLEFYTDRLNKSVFPFIKNLNEIRNNDEYYNFNTLYFMGMGFTPSRDFFDDESVVPSQRPYASLIGVGRKRLAVWDADTINANTLWNIPIPIAIETDFFFGVVGSKAPGEFQNWIHANISNSDTVKGWENQIANGGRPAIKYRVQSTIGIGAIGNMNLYSRQHLTLGTIFSNAGLGFSITDRTIQSMGLMNAMGSNRLDVLDPTGNVTYSGFLSHFDYEIYAVATSVWRNTLLEGYPIQDNSVYTISPDRIEPIVLDVGAKIIFNYLRHHTNVPTYNAHVSFFLEFVYRSKEFDIHESHVFANLGFTVMQLGY